VKISVIFTGGTIGSAVKDGYMSTDDTAKYVLLEKYDNKNNDVKFETSSPYTVLSENLSAREINLLLKEISSKLSEDYDGIIVTHGTDSLQYSAAAAELSFAGCDIPVVFVSSDFPPEDERANAHINFEAAVEFIKKGRGGVYVSYKNDDEDEACIHIASRILQHRECDANIYSIDKIPFAVYNGEIIFNDINIPENKNPFGLMEYAEDSGILVIESHPGDSFSYSLSGIKAVIIKPYHSATLNTASPALKAFCKEAERRGIKVYVPNVKGGVSYESVKEFSEMNIIPFEYGTYIYSYMKLWAELSKRSGC